MKIITAVVNNPIFIEIQFYTLKKYFKGDFEFIVFNDAKDFPDFTNNNDITIKQQIIDICNKLNITIINIPNEHHKQELSAAIRCANSMNFILNYQKNNPDKYLIIDSDMFLIDYFDISIYNNYDCAIVLQSRNNDSINYFWNGIYYFNMNIMKNQELLNWNLCYNCDVGGMMNQWLLKQLKNGIIPTTDDLRWNKNNNYNNSNVYFIKHLWSLTWDITELPEKFKNNNKLISFLENDFRNQNNKFFCEIYDNSFFHYRAGGNWRKEGLDIHNYLTKELYKVFIGDDN